MVLFLILPLRKWYSFILIFLWVLVSGCGPTLKETPKVPKEVIESEREKQRKIALYTYFQRRDKIYNVWYNLITSSALFCKKNIKPVYGFEVHDKKMYEEKDIKLLSEKYLIDERPTVVYIHPNLPASQAGLRVNDKIIKAQDKEVKDSRELWEIINKNKFQKLKLLVERNGELINLEMSPVEGCDYDVFLIFHESINAWASPPNRVFVTTGLMRFIQDEKELAFILGHELSHHILGHLTKTMTNVTIGSVIDILISITTGVNTQGIFQQLGGLIYSKQFEREADYLGTYIAARSGYDVSDAPEIWRRLAAEFPTAISDSFLADHPSTPERFLFIEKTVKEIEEKKAKGEPLIPSDKFFQDKNRKESKRKD